jgi:hypothetical protein
MRQRIRWSDVKPIGVARLILATAVVVAAVAGGCSDAPKYAPPKHVAPESLCALKTKNLTLVSVDGATFGPFQSSYQIEPGERMLEIDLTTFGSGSSVRFHFPARFEPGRAYTLYPERGHFFTVSVANFYLRDETTGKVEQYPKIKQ